MNASGVEFGSPVDMNRMVQQGDVWIGISSKANSARGLQQFDPARYAPLNWASPVPVADRCAQPSIIPIYMIGEQAFQAAAAAGASMGSSPETEDGLIWDMLGQLGLLLKSEQRHQILPGFGETWAYMDGVSQSSIYLRTWLAGFANRYRTPDGRPVYDGYLGIVGPAMVRINQCAADVPLADPRQQLLPAPEVPYISISSEGEMWQGKYTRQPDVVTPTGGIVTYEVAGGSHMGAEVPGVAPDALMVAAMAHLRGSGAAAPAMPPGMAGFTFNDFVWAPLTRGAYHNLQLWVRQGVLPPQAPPIEVDADMNIRRDQYGNALGGLRMPYIDHPVAAHIGSLGAGGMAGVIGRRDPLPPATIQTLYPTHADYVAAISAATDRLAAGRWISPEDAAAMKRAAEAASVPEAR